MGAEAKCRIRHDGKDFEAKVLLETSEIVVRGDNRFRIPFSSIRKVETKGEDLIVQYDAHQAAFTLGAAASKWKAKIENPPTLLSKLGIKPGLRISIVGVSDSDFDRAMAEAGIESSEKLESPSDLILLGLEDTSALAGIHRARRYLKPDGALWLVYPKGSKVLPESRVMEVVKEAGLVDTKVAAFSKSHTAIKVMIPVASRAAR